MRLALLISFYRRRNPRSERLKNLPKFTYHVNPCSSCTSSIAGIITAKTIDIEVRKKVTNPNTLLRGRGSLIRRKSNGRKSVFTWIYIGGWAADERRSWINGSSREVSASLMLSGFSSKWNSVTGWKESSGFLCLSSAWGTSGLKLLHLPTGAASAHRFSGSLEMVKEDQTSCLSCCPCTRFGNRSSTGAETKTLLFVRVLHQGRALKRRGGREAGQGKGKRSEHVCGRDHRSVDPTVKQALAFFSPDWSVVSCGLPLGKGA